MTTTDSEINGFLLWISSVYFSVRCSQLIMKSQTLLPQGQLQPILKRLQGLGGVLFGVIGAEEVRL